VYFCHLSWIICVCIGVCLGSLLCSWDADRSRVAARVGRVVSSLVWGRDLSPLYSFACIDVTLSIWSFICPDGVVRVSNIAV
jgi:hypothetical protein